MGLTYSMNIDVSDDGMEQLTGSLDSFTEQFDETVTKTFDEYNAENKEHNKKVDEIVDRCKHIYLQRQLSKCSEYSWMRTLRGTEEDCKKFDLDLFECGGEYMKLLSKRY